MRKIIRGTAPEFWIKAHRQYRKYRELTDAQGDELRQRLREHLIETQIGLCGYCCRAIGMDNSHNEHIKPQDSYERLSMEYKNLIASCNHGETCGVYKKNKYDERFVSPLDDDCEDHFKYATDGSIIGITESGRITISLLNLNNYALKNIRKTALKYCYMWDDKEELAKYYHGSLDKPPTGLDIIEYYCRTNELDQTPT